MKSGEADGQIVPGFHRLRLDAGGLVSYTASGFLRRNRNAKNRDILLSIEKSHNLSIRKHLVSDKYFI